MLDLPVELARQGPTPQTSTPWRDAASMSRYVF
jgi:hypothetical protein